MSSMGASRLIRVVSLTWGDPAEALRRGLMRAPIGFKKDKMVQAIRLRGVELRGTSGVASSATNRSGRSRRATGAGRCSGNVSCRLLFAELLSSHRLVS